MGLRASPTIAKRVLNRGPSDIDPRRTARSVQPDFRSAMHSAKAFACVPALGLVLTPFLPPDEGALPPITNATWAQSPAVIQAPGDAEDEPGYLGISYDEKEEGILVTKVIAGTPAERAGMQKGDVIVTAGDHRVQGPATLLDALAAAGVGGKLVLGVMRAEDTLQLEVLLASRENPAGTGPDRDEMGGEERGGQDTQARLEREIRTELRRLEAGEEGPVAEGTSEPNPRETTRVFGQNEGEAEILEALRALGYAADPESQPDTAPQPEPGFLGVMLDGLTITDTVPESPAQAAGLRSGETLRAIDGEPIDSLSALGEMLAQRSAGTSCTIGLAGPLGEREVVVTLGARPEEFERETLESPEETGQEPEPFFSAESDASEQRAFLGIGLFEEDGRVMVERVLAGTPAELAGVQVGDRIVKLRGRGIDSTEELLDLLGKLKIGKTYPLVVERDGRKVRLNATLAPRPSGELSEPLGEGEGNGLFSEPDQPLTRARQRLQREEQEITRRLEEMRRNFAERERGLIQELERVRGELGRGNTREALSGSPRRDVDDLRGTLRSLRAEIEALREEVRTLRRELQDR